MELARFGLGDRYWGALYAALRTNRTASYMRCFTIVTAHTLRCCHYNFALGPPPLIALDPLSMHCLASLTMSSMICLAGLTS